MQGRFLALPRGAGGRLDPTAAPGRIQPRFPPTRPPAPARLGPVTRGRWTAPFTENPWSHPAVVVERTGSPATPESTRLALPPRYALLKPHSPARKRSPRSRGRKEASRRHRKAPHPLPLPLRPSNPHHPPYGSAASPQPVRSAHAPMQSMQPCPAPHPPRKHSFPTRSAQRRQPMRLREKVELP